MTDERALKGFRNMLNDLKKDNGLFVGTINPEMIEVAIKAIEYMIEERSVELIAEGEE